jgi:hypothetical protein
MSLENQFIYPYPKWSKLIFFAPLGAWVNEENQYLCNLKLDYKNKTLSL